MGSHRTRLQVIATVSILLAWPRPTVAWSFEVHRYIVERAIELLPPPIRPFYERHRVFVVEHSIDPDLWRSVGFEEEPPRHFLDLDAYGRYPFKELPRDYEAAVRKFGREKLREKGLLPWRIEEIYGRLVGALEQVKRQPTSLALSDVMLFSAVLAHYVGDGHVPLHAVLNYDGQLTGQHGVHARFEAELFRRYRAKLTIRPAVPASERRPRDFTFDTLLESFELVDPILKADRTAVAGRDVYDDAYFDRFFQLVRPILERRLAASITAVGAMIAGAWEQAGRPDLPLEPPRLIQRVKPTRP